MTRISVPWKSWVVVADGARALFLQNDGDAELLNLRVAENYSHADEPTREIGTDRPGRAHQSVGFGRSAMEETDFHAEAEETFLKTVADRINAMVYAKDMKGYVLIAPPAALGVLRKNLNDASSAAMTAEVTKDLTKMPVGDIEKHLAALRAG